MSRDTINISDYLAFGPAMAGMVKGETDQGWICIKM